MDRPITIAVGTVLVLLTVTLRSQLAVEASPKATTAAAAPRSSAQDKRAELMRLKLDYAKNVLEGLTLEKMDLVAENARQLKLLSAAAEWEPVTVPGPLYLDYTREFQRIADALATHAKDGNLDGATVAYVQLTINCVQCHKHVRVTDR